MKKLLIVAALMAASLSAQANDKNPVDLSKPFTCPDVSANPMRITEKGLVMNGVLYPLNDPNASNIDTITNIIFKSNDGLSEIDVTQFSKGNIEVSYMKFRINPDDLRSFEEIEKAKIFEKGSSEALNPAPFYHSKDQGCENVD